MKAVREAWQSESWICSAGSALSAAQRKKSAALNLSDTANAIRPLSPPIGLYMIREENIFAMTQEQSTQMNCLISTFLSAVFPASRSALVVSEDILKISEACCSLSLPEFLKPKSLLTFSLRTFPQSVRSVKGKSSLQYSAKYLDWGIVANGNVLTAGLMSPRAESECSLRDILIPDVPAKYYLSAEKSLRLLPNSQVTELRENGSTTPEEVP